MNLRDKLTSYLFSHVHAHFINEINLIIVPDKAELSAERKISNHQSTRKMKQQ
jgi:hypothetical protein